MNFCEIDEGFLHHRRHILEKENWFSLEKISFNVWITMDNQNKISALEKKKKQKQKSVSLLYQFCLPYLIWSFFYLCLTSNKYLFLCLLSKLLRKYTWQGGRIYIEQICIKMLVHSLNRYVILSTLNIFSIHWYVSVKMKIIIFNFEKFCDLCKAATNSSDEKFMFLLTPSFLLTCLYFTFFLNI